MLTTLIKKVSTFTISKALLFNSHSRIVLPSSRRLSTQQNEGRFFSGEYDENEDNEDTVKLEEEEEDEDTINNPYADQVKKLENALWDGDMEPLETISDPEGEQLNRLEVEKYRKKSGKIEDMLFHSQVHAKMAELEMNEAIQHTDEQISPKKSCELCRLIGRKGQIDAMNTPLLSRYLTPHGSIIPRIITGTCSKHQRKISRAYKKAKHLGLISHKHGSFAICNPFPSGIITIQKLKEMRSADGVPLSVPIPIIDDYFDYAKPSENIEDSMPDEGGISVSDEAALANFEEKERNRKQFMVKNVRSRLNQLKK